MEIEVGIGYDDNGETILETLPAKFEVCRNCEGHGSVLNPSIARHAYTQEEFNEEFDEEERAEYFKRGGRYDVKCPHCNGERVVLGIDVNACTPDQKVHLAAHIKWQYEIWYEREQNRRIMMMEDGFCANYDW